MSPYTTSKSNLVTQDLTPPRTGNFGAHAHILPGDPTYTIARLQAIFHRMNERIQKLTDDDRAYTIEIKIVTNITLHPWEAEIGEYVHRDHFHPDPENENMIFELPNSTEKRVFQPTRQGYQRIE